MIRPLYPPAAPAALALAATLEQLAAVLGALTDDQYVQRPVGPVASSIGGHVRHSLDHVRCLVRGVREGVIDYDRRERGTPVESLRCAALAEIERLAGELRAIPAAAQSQRLTLVGVVTGDGPAVHVQTTVGRELVFTLSHTIHHDALVAVMVAILGVLPPPRFGYAPATLAHAARQSEESLACAR
jgi:uncharacterized damage-inducible protein DinB